MDKIIKLKKTLDFWKEAGFDRNYFLFLIFGNITTKALGGAGIALLIPIARGLINQDFSFIPDYVPFIKDLSNLQIFIILAILILVLNIIQSFLSYKLDLFKEKKNLEITSNVIKNIFKSQISTNKSFFDETDIGKYYSKISRTPNILLEILETFYKIIGDVVQILIFCLVILYISPIIFLATFPLVLIVFLATLFFRRKIKSLAREELEEDSNFGKLFYNSFIRIPLIKIHNSQNVELVKFDEVSQGFVEKKFRMKKFLQIINPIQDTLIFIAVFVTALVLSFYSNSNQIIDVASLLVYFLVFHQILKTISSVSVPIITLPHKMTIVESIKNNFTEYENFDLESRDLQKFEELKNDIVCKDLSFGYKNNKDALNGLNCKIPAKKITVIFGETGSGKTTLVNLLSGLYDAPNKSIYLDEIDINNYSKESLNKSFFYISQDPILFDDSLRNNLCYGLEEFPEDKDIWKILEKVKLDNMVLKSKKELDSKIGDRGVKLSGGEKKKLSLARALLNNSSIIIFDEPTSSLDMGTEGEIIKLIKEISQNRTIIIVSHSNNVIKCADYLIKMKNGSIFEESFV